MRNMARERWGAHLHKARDGALDFFSTLGATSLSRWRWKFELPVSLTSYLPSGSSVRGVATAPKLLLLALLVLQLLVLGVLRSAPSTKTVASSTFSPGYVGSSRTLYAVRKGVLKGGEISSPATQGGGGGGETRGAEDGVLSASLDDAATAVSTENPNQGTREEVHNTSDELHEDQLSKISTEEPEEHGPEELPEKADVEVHAEDEQPGEDSSEEDEAQTTGEDADQEALVSASEAAFLEEDPVCKGGRIFVYDLPPMFNSDLVANCSVLNPWVSLCDAFSNGGLGKPMGTTPWPSSKPSPWFYTEQFSGELIFHTRILQHPCVTNDSTSANVFYVPFYAGLDVSRYLWKPSVAEDRDHLGRKLVKWLSSQRAWSRKHGRDHFTMIGRITWDFRRTEDKEWGSGLLHMPEMKNMTRLVIESNPWEGGEYGVPYPTSFHPRNEHQMQEWQEFVRSKDRSFLFSFAGATRKRIPNDFRLELLAQCSNSRGACSAIDCSDSKCETPEPALELFLNSTFCLQPRGDSYTRRSIFDSALAGCIPVFFWNQSSYWQYKWFFPEEDESYSVFIDKEDVRKGKKVMEVLSGISEEDVQRMRNNLVDALPKLVYATADHQLSGADAFDTAIDGILRTMLKINLRSGGLQMLKSGDSGGSGSKRR